VARLSEAKAGDGRRRRNVFVPSSLLYPVRDLKKDRPLFVIDRLAMVSECGVV
jgi:hypothetical protein